MPGHHEDLQATVGKVAVQFFWKPYVKDQLAYAKALIESKDTYVDVLVLGNGEWDCLHNSDSSEAYKSTLQELTLRLEELKRRRGTGVLWVTPPSVNDAKLTTDEKKEKMTEERVREYRSYQEVITSSADFDLFVDFGKMTETR